MIRRIGPYVCIAILAFLAYGPVLWNGAGWSSMDDGDAAASTCCAFRPLVALSYTFNRHFGGWMVTNFGLHAIASLLLLSIAGPAPAALFAVHPMAADSVASVAGRSTEILAVCVLGAILIGRKKPRLGIALGLLLAGFSAGFVPSYISSLPHPGNRLEYARHYVSAFGSYIIPNMIGPLRLSADPDIPHEGWSEFIGWSALALLTVGMVHAIAERRLRLAFGLTLLPLVPYMFVPLPDVFFEHRAYLALAGISIILAVALRNQVVIGLCAGLFLIGSHYRVAAYSSPLRLWTDAVHASPMKGRPHNNLAGIYARAERWDDAQRELELAIVVDPDEGTAWENLAMLHFIREGTAEANKVLDEHDRYLLRKGLH